MRFRELVPSETRIDFLRPWRLCAGLSVGLVLLSLAAALSPWRGVRLGIDFAGGTEVLVRFEPGIVADEGKLRPLVTACGAVEPTVIRYGEGESEFLLRFRRVASAETVESALGRGDCPLTPADREALEAAARAEGGEDPMGALVDRLAFALRNAVGPLSVERVEYVGPRVGEELRRDGLAAIGLGCLLILVYVGFRFGPRYAPGAVVALVHDVSVTAGAFVLLGLEFDLQVLAALLAVLGYSVNDTIIIYDRIRENVAIHTKQQLRDLINQSVNQTLSRTVLTSGTTLLVVLCLLVLGGEVIRPFAIAMTIGILVGTYSTVYIASPLLLWLEERAMRGRGGAQAAERAGGAEQGARKRSAPARRG